MFESVKGRHKHIVIAAIAVSAMLMYAIPAAVAQDFTNDPDQDLAQSIVDKTNQDIDQKQEQEQEQEAENEAEQSNEATVSQDETNDQSNVLVTGDNDATTSQSGSNTANENSATAVSEGGDGGCCDDDKHHKHDKCDSCGSGGDSEAEASVDIDQDVSNDAVTVQDSSADGNTLSNENKFGDDIAIVDQDNIADQRAVNVGLQNQDQDADQTDFDFNFQYGFQCRADQSVLSAAC